MRGAAYGTTAWAFGHVKPALSEKLRKNILAGGGEGAQEVASCSRAWNVSRDAAIKPLDDMAAKYNNIKPSMQASFKALCNGDQATLSKSIMQQLEPQLANLPQSVMLAWRSSYSYLYPE